MLANSEKPCLQKLLSDSVSKMQNAGEKGEIVARRQPYKRAVVREETFAARGDYITLGQLLKLAGLLSSGGEVKSFLAETSVLVNGEPDTRRGRKLYPGDLVVIPGQAALRIAGERLSEPTAPNDAPPILDAPQLPVSLNAPLHSQIENEGEPSPLDEALPDHWAEDEGERA